MAKIIVYTGILIFLSSCAAVKSPMYGHFHKNIKTTPFLSDMNNNISTKVGSAEVVSVLGIKAVGNASVNAAARSAGISEIHLVEEHVTSTLRIFSRYRIIVYGN